MQVLFGCPTPQTAGKDGLTTPVRGAAQLALLMQCDVDVCIYRDAAFLHFEGKNIFTERSQLLLVFCM